MKLAKTAKTNEYCAFKPFSIAVYTLSHVLLTLDIG